MEAREDLYDPRFLLTFFAGVLGKGNFWGEKRRIERRTGSEWRPDLRSFIAKGCLHLALAGTAFHDAAFRSLAFLGIPLLFPSDSDSLRLSTCPLFDMEASKL